MTLFVISLVSLAVILVLAVVMAVSCYDAGVVGTLALAAIALAAAVVLMDFRAYQLALPTVVLEAGVAVFLLRHYARFHMYRRRERQRRCIDLGTWPFFKERRREPQAHP